MVKMKVREESMKYGASKKREFLRNEDEIERSIAALEKQLSQDNLNGNLKQKFWSDLETKKRELEVIIEHEQKEAL